MAENDANFYYNKGINYNEDGKYGLAVDNFKLALSMDPDSIEINFNLGVAYINKKEYSIAIECFKTVLQKSPDETAALSNIALAYAKINEFNTAINYYKKILAIKPDDVPTFKDLGDTYTKNRQYDEAIENYREFLKIHPTSFLVKESLNTALNLKKNQAGIKADQEPAINKQLRSNSGENDKSASEYFDLAVNYVKEQNFDTAIENLRKCLTINSNHPNAYDLLNKLFKIKEKSNTNATLPKKEPPATEPVKTEPPKTPTFIDYRRFNEFYTLGVAYYNAQNFEMALENFKQGNQINPDDKTCNEYISKIMGQSKK